MNKTKKKYIYMELFDGPLATRLKIRARGKKDSAAVHYHHTKFKSISGSLQASLTNNNRKCLLPGLL